MSGMMLSRATRTNVGWLGVPCCLITSAVPSQLLPTKSTGTTALGLPAGAAVAEDATLVTDAAATLAANNAATRIATVFLPTAITDASTLLPVTPFHCTSTDRVRRRPGG